SISVGSWSDITFLLSPGKPALQAVWILLDKTRYNTKFYQSTLEQGVQEVNIPFDIAAEYIPPRLPDDEKLAQLTVGQVPVDAAFDDIITQNPDMTALKFRAQILAQREVPVLIQGKTGTGKELFATAIHNARSRKKGSFVAVN